MFLDDPVARLPIDDTFDVRRLVTSESARGVDIAWVNPG
jgi:hypothetical protein